MPGIYSVHDAIIGVQSALGGRGGGLRYLLRDEFTTDRAAGAVTGTAAEPTGGNRTVVDTNSKISISGNVLVFATGAVVNDGVWWASQSRSVGTVFLAKVTPSDTNGIIVVGWDSNQSGAISDSLKFSSGGAIQIVSNGGSAVSVGSYTATAYRVAALMRAAGVFWLIKGGAFTNWTLLFISAAGTGAGYPSIQAGSTTSVFTAG